MRYRRLAWMVLAVAIVGHAALAMNIRKTRTLLARGADGSSLFEVHEDGPEGGGALSYRIEGTSRRDAKDYAVSSDFSPGDGSQPQTISAKVCAKRLAALGAELTKRKFVGVTLHPEGCKQGRRNDLVEVAGARP